MTKLLESLVFLLAGFILGYRLQKPASRGLANIYLGLIAYPNVRVLYQRDNNRDSKTIFEAGAGLEELYGYFHEQLIDLGWERTDLEIDDEEIEAKYRRGEEAFELEIEHEGRNRYELEVEFED